MCLRSLAVWLSEPGVTHSDSSLSFWCCRCCDSSVDSPNSASPISLTRGRAFCVCDFHKKDRLLHSAAQGLGLNRRLWPASRRRQVHPVSLSPRCCCVQACSVLVYSLAQPLDDRLPALILLYPRDSFFLIGSDACSHELLCFRLLQLRGSPAPSLHRLRLPVRILQLTCDSISSHVGQTIHACQWKLSICLVCRARLRCLFVGCCL